MVKGLKSCSVPAGLFCTVFLFFMLFACTDQAGLVQKEDENAVSAGVYITGDRKESPVFLYFGDRKRSYLVAEERVILHSDDPVLFGKQIIRELTRGSNNGLMRTLPADSVLRAFFVTRDKTAYADFSRDLPENHPGGAVLENLTLYSIVNSLILNLPEVERVKILIEGQEAETLAGHIDVRQALSADMLIVR